MRQAFFPSLVALCAMSMALPGCAAELVDNHELDADDAFDAGMEQLSKARSQCDDRCSPSCPCQEGEGDCDSNKDCVAGLICPPDGKGIERCQKKSGGGSGGSSSGGSSSTGSSNLQVRLGGSWKGVCCSGGELEVSGGKCSWTESSRKLATKDLRTGQTTRLNCPENGQRPTDCSCTSSGEAMHGVRENGNVHVKNSLRKSGGAPLYPNSGHETCIDLVGGELQSRRSNSSCPNWRLVNFY
jgi:hypothetical protein